MVENMRVAIIGAGISGLVAADRLQHQHEVTVFEANPYLGGHTNTVDVQLDGEHHAIDTGFIVFNHRTYPNFVRLLSELGVQSRLTNMGFGVRDDRTGLEYSGESLNSLFAQRLNLLRPRFYRMVADILRFHRTAVALVKDADEQQTVGEFLQEHRFSNAFAEQFLLPMGAAIWSCPTGTFSQFPIRFLVEFYDHHGLLTVVNRPIWHVVERGSRSYVKALQQRFHGQVRLKTPVSRIVRRDDGIDLCPAHAGSERFDHIVFACHSNQALAILGEQATAVERKVLSAFPYQHNVAVLHTDRSVLPKRRLAWASWNYRIPREASAAATVTYNMNLLQGIQSRHTFCVTLNDTERIDPKLELRRFEYEHPIFTVERAAAQARHEELLNQNRTSYCGAYWGNGFHEAGVNSGLAVAKALSPSSHIMAGSTLTGILAP